MTAELDTGPGPKPFYTNAEVIEVFSRWGNPWTIDTIGFTFLQSSASTGFQPFSATQIAATKLALGLFSDIIDLSFMQRADDGNYANEITFENMSHDAGIWGTGGGGANSGGVYVDDDYVSQSFGIGSYNLTALLHEIGHALNVLHPGEYNAGPGVTLSYENNADYVQDTRQYTVMSYWSASETGASHAGYYASTPLLHDVLGFQAIYGANMETRTGDTVYGFNSNAVRNVFNFEINASPIIAIWDAGGVDKIDLSGYSMACVLDLREGAFSSVGGLTFNVAICYDAEIENGVGGSASDTITGNNLANVLLGMGGDDVMQGGDGADRLDGGSGSDTMRGGVGGDTYVVNANGDRTIETSSSGGIDLVQSSVTRTLGEFLENLTLTGGAAIDGSGNGLANTLTGNGAANILSGLGGADVIRGGGGGDRLIGGAGGDTLTGGAGKDAFLLNAAIGATNIDNVTDFAVGADKIELENSVFTALGAVGALAAQAFYRGANAHDASDRLLYQASTGALFYDRDGTGGAAKIQIAVLDAGLALTAADFLVV
ncbi:MAG: M10 family metallopeptidase C-terminal domain-containing protein [Hyphomonadaceae bacterium]|nr:M10 family metallopeptidase C-terminal domain-containing protein [Hyphomonadaceae bacterium]